MTQPEIRERDGDMLVRLARLADVDVPATAPWPTVQTAVRRSRRRRAMAGATAALATAAVLALAVPLVLPGTSGTTPAAPGDASSAPAPRWSPGSTADRLGMTFGEVYLEVEFDVTVLAQEPMPAGGGECVLIDPAELMAAEAAEAAEAGRPVPDLSDVAAAGCRGGIVGQPLTASVTPDQPFAGQPVTSDTGVEPCVLVDTGRVTTRGLLLAAHSEFDCAGGSLQQWVFESVLMWSLDGGPRIAEVVQTAELDVPR